MGLVQTNWHLGDLELPDDTDPMAEIAQLKSGEAIDLIRDEEAVEAEFQATLRREAGIFNFDGTTCKLKWKASHRIAGGSGPSCFTCRHYRGDATGEANDSRAAVCRIGREQEGLVAELEAIRCKGQLDTAVIEAVERDVDLCTAMAAESDVDSATELAEALL